MVRLKNGLAQARFFFELKFAKNSSTNSRDLVFQGIVGHSIAPCHVCLIHKGYFLCRLLVRMVKVMFEEISRKAIFEVTLLALVAMFSLSVCSLLIADASIALSVERYGLALVAIRICELALGMMWLFFSVKMILEIHELRKKHVRIFTLPKLEKLQNLEEQKRSVATEVAMDMMAFYRTNYTKAKAILAIAIAVGLLIIVTVTCLMLYGLMSFWVAIFRWALSSLMLLVASALYVYVHRSWGRKLLRAKDAEKKLSEMLGGPIEA